MLSFEEFAKKIRKGNPNASESGLKKMYAAYKSKVSESVIDDLVEEMDDIEEMLSFDEFAAKIKKGNPNASEDGLKKMYAAYKSKAMEACGKSHGEMDDEEDEEDDEEDMDEAVVARRSLKSRLAAARKRNKPMDAKRKKAAKRAALWRKKNKAKIKSYKRRYKAPTKSISHRESVEQAIRNVAEGGDVSEAVEELLNRVL